MLTHPEQRQDVAIGIDLGTSSLKAVAVNADGDVLARGSSPYPTARPEDGAAEQDPADWILAFEAVVEAIADAVDPGRWASIGLSAMLPTLVCLDDERSVVGPALTWEDGRAEAEAELLAELVGRDRLYRLTGQRVDGRYLLPMFSRLVTTRQVSTVTTIAGAKDYLFWFLTGELLTDPSTAAGYGAYDLAEGRWDAGILSAGPPVRLPDVRPSTEQRPLLPALARRFGCAAGLPVVLGAADSVLGAAGLGATEPCDIAYIAGTSTVILGHCDALVLDEHQRYLVTPTVGDGFALEMDLLATGSAHGWLAEFFALPGGATELAALAGSAPPSDRLLFLPYLTPGEQGALWDPHLTGVLHGLTLRTTRADAARALVSGVVVESARAIEVLDDAFGSADLTASDGGPPGRRGTIRVSGQSASSPHFRQDLADATGRRVHFDPGTTDHSALGAAQLAASAVAGWSIRPAAPSGTVTQPDPGRLAFWQGLRVAHDDVRRRAGRSLGT